MDRGTGAVRGIGAAGGLERSRASHLRTRLTSVQLAGQLSTATVPERHTQSLWRGMHPLPLPLDVPQFTISLFWHPRLDADPAHQWLRTVVVDVCRHDAW